MFHISDLTFLRNKHGWMDGEYDDTLSRFDTTPERDRRTDRRTEGRIELLYQYRFVVLTRDKNQLSNPRS